MDSIIGSYRVSIATRRYVRIWKRNADSVDAWFVFGSSTTNRRLGDSVPTSAGDEDGGSRSSVKVQAVRAIFLGSAVRGREQQSRRERCGG